MGNPKKTKNMKFAIVLVVAALVAAAGVDATQTCSDPKLGACGTVAVPSPVPQIWGGGGCQDLVHAGIDASEHFLCEGLSSALSSFCFAGAPVCEAALDEGCDMLLDYVCDAGCMATWTCHEFHACKSGPSSSCCKK